MEFKEFIAEVVDKIPDYLMFCAIDKIQVEEVKKNNGVICTGIVIMKKGENIAPNIYLELYYELYRYGKSMDEILKAIAVEYKEAYERIKNKGIRMIDCDSFQKMAFMKLINYEKNKKMLEECPYVKFHDLAITFRYLVGNDDEGIVSAMVRNEDLKRWGLGEKELYSIARENTLKLFPPKLSKLSELMRDMGEEIYENACDTDLYVLTNISGINGATSMLYEDIIYGFAKEKNSNLYILPSSVHEVLLLPAKENMDRRDLECLVSDINRHMVSDVDYLSDSVYYFNLKNGNLTV